MRVHSRARQFGHTPRRRVIPCSGKSIAPPRFGPYAVLLGIALAACITGCDGQRDRANVLQQNRELRDEIGLLTKRLNDCNSDSLACRQQIESLQTFPPNRPADLFAPTRIEFASLSGGTDFDGEPGDDGLTLYLRPLDIDGESVKVPGKITIQLLDNTDLSVPRLIGTYIMEDPDRLRKSWFGHFGTKHYTLKCPFPKNVVLPESGRVSVAVQFVDYLTGKTLTNSKDFDVSLPQRPAN